MRRELIAFPISWLVRVREEDEEEEGEAFNVTAQGNQELLMELQHFRSNYISCSIILGWCGVLLNIILVYLSAAKTGHKCKSIKSSSQEFSPHCGCVALFFRVVAGRAGLLSRSWSSRRDKVA